MKNIIGLLALTIMLRVWWPDYREYNLNFPTGTGIVSSWTTIDIYSYAIVVTKNGIFKVPMSKINKWKWVDVKADK